MRQNERETKAGKAGKAVWGKVCTGLFFATCLSLTGCGGSTAMNQPASGGAVSGGAVSGGAVSESAIIDKKEKTVREQTNYRYATDTNVYYMSERRTIMQARRDGTHKKEILGEPKEGKVAEPAGCQLANVDEDWLYYTVCNGSEKQVLYRVPIEKDKKGYDVVKSLEKEEIIRDSSICITCWDSRYLVYQYDEGIAVYDMQEKKYRSRYETAEIVGEERDKELEEEPVWEMFRLPDCFVAFNEDGDICAWHTEDGNWKSCRDKQWIASTYDMVVQTENRIFYEAEQEEDVEDLDDWSVFACDGKKSECFITMNQVRQSVEKARGTEAAANVHEGSVQNLFGSKDRLYLQIALNWDDGPINRSEVLLFSQGESESELRYEKELTECMQSKVRTRTGKWWLYDNGDKLEEVFRENAVYNDAQCVAVLNGRAYLSLYDYEKDKGHMGCYDLQSGTFRWVSKKEAAFGELGCEGLYYDDDLDLYTVFLNKNESMWMWTGVWANPEDREDVVFKEDK